MSQANQRRWCCQRLGRVFTFTVSNVKQFCHFKSRLKVLRSSADLQLYSVSQKNPPPPWNFLTFSPNSWEYLVQILHAYYTFLSMLDYKFLFNYLQHWRSYAILSTTTIMCSKRPPSTKTHAGWSHLMWHNFVIVGDNWIKICILEYVRMFNRCVKFGSKNPNCLGKMSENASVRFSLWWTSCAHDVNWVVTLNIA